VPVEVDMAEELQVDVAGELAVNVGRVALTSQCGGVAR